jgi:hypothetical protein
MDIFERLGSQSIMIHKRDKLKLLQKKFFKLIRNNIENGNINNLEEYMEVLNDENIDIKFLFLKNNELRFN